MNSPMTIAKLACKVLTSNSDFCKKLGIMGTLGIPENDPIFIESQKTNFDMWLYQKGISPEVFWVNFGNYLKTNSCQELYNFTYNPALKPWEQIWQ